MRPGKQDEVFSELTDQLSLENFIWNLHWLKCHLVVNFETQISIFRRPKMWVLENVWTPNSCLLRNRLADRQNELKIIKKMC